MHLISVKVVIQLIKKIVLYIHRFIYVPLKYFIREKNIID
jgi:hypothetical protein